MTKMKLSELGESVCIILKGKTKKGVLLEKLKRGKWVIFYGEIPGVAIGDGKFLIYPHASEKCIEELDRVYYEPKYFPDSSPDKPPRDNKWYEQCMRTHRIMRSNW